MSSIYLDYAATTPLDPDVLREMLPYLTNEFGNPSSIYSDGQSAKHALERARNLVAVVLGFDPTEITFTSGATESDNLALSGVVWATRQRGAESPHIVTTAIEHSAVIEHAEWLRSIGFGVTFVAPDSDGLVSAQSITDAITTETVLISIMYANNEVGSIQPIADVARIAKAMGIPLHVDATQAVGLLPIHSSVLNADLISLSGHKFYGPKGVGVLGVRRGVDMTWQQHGGGQEGGRRGGTENVAGIVGLAQALIRADESRDAYEAHCRTMRDHLWEKIAEAVDDVYLNGPSLDGQRLSNSLNLGFPGLQGETMLVNLDLAGVAASAGSACTVGKNEPSHVLLAMGRTIDEARSSLRLTVGRGTSLEEIEEAAGIIAETVQRTRSLSGQAIRRS